jgi:hypothetical protein
VLSELIQEALAIRIGYYFLHYMHGNCSVVHSSVVRGGVAPGATSAVAPVYQLHFNNIPENLRL